MASPDSEEFEIQRLPSRHPRLRAAVLAAVVLTAAGLGIAGRLTSRPTATATNAVAAVASETAALTPQPSPNLAEVVSVDCGGLSGAQCEAIYVAATAVIPAGLPPIDRVAVNPSLLCDSALDCPPSVLTHEYGLGSAVVSFSDGSADAWLNVVAANDSATEHTEAWIVRWVPRPKGSPAPETTAAP